MAFVNEKVLQCLPAPVSLWFYICWVGCVWGGVLMEHSLGTDCFLCLNWSNLMASLSLTSPKKVLNYSEALPSLHLVWVR